MEITCRAGRDDIHLAFLFVPFPFSGGIGKRRSAGYDRKVPEYTEFLRNFSRKYNLEVMDVEDRDDIPYNQQYRVDTSTKSRAYQCPPKATQSPKTIYIWKFSR